MRDCVYILGHVFIMAGLVQQHHLNQIGSAVSIPTLRNYYERHNTRSGSVRITNQFTETTIRSADQVKEKSRNKISHVQQPAKQPTKEDRKLFRGLHQSDHRSRCLESLTNRGLRPPPKPVLDAAPHHTTADPKPVLCVASPPSISP